MLEQITSIQIETIEQIIVALVTSFVGTGTIALIVKTTLNNLIKKTIEKITLAEDQNKISTKSAQTQIQGLYDLQTILTSQIDSLNEEIVKMLERNKMTDEQIKNLIDLFNEKNETLKRLIESEFGNE
jgi:predicted transcriptional regulator